MLQRDGGLLDSSFQVSLNKGSGALFSQLVQQGNACKRISE